MSEKDKKKALWVDEDTHMEIVILAARKKVSIKKYLKEMVEREKTRNTLSPKPKFKDD